MESPAESTGLNRIGGGALALAVWTGLWWLPWQPWLEEWPFVRVAIGLLMTILPGACVQRLLGAPASSWGRDLTVGLLISTALTGAFGLAAGFAHASIRLVSGGLWVTGAAALVAHCAAPRPAPRTALWGARDLAVLLPAAAAVAVAARLALTPDAAHDNLAYMAMIGEYGRAGELGFGDFVHGGAQLAPSRFWLAYWPLVLAVVGRNAGMDGVELSALYISPLLAVVCTVGVFELARALGLSRRTSLLAVVVQVVSLVLLTKGDQAGSVFFGRLREDKVVAAFVLAPVWFRLVAEHLATPRRPQWALVAAGGVGLLFTHPTMFGVACLIAALTALLDALVSHRVRPAATILLVAAVLPLVPFSFRFVDQPYAQRLHFTVADARRAGDLPGYRAKRLAFSDDGRSYRLKPALIDGAPFAVAFAAGALALARLRRDAAARFVAASMAVVGSVLLSPGAWLLGLAITPFHLWRVPWITPFGIAAGLLAHAAGAWVPRRLAAARGWIGVAVAASAELAALAYAVDQVAPTAGRPRLRSVVLAADWRSVVPVRTVAGEPRCPFTFAELRAIGERLDAIIAREAPVMGDRHVNDVIPGVSAKAAMLFFRSRDDRPPGGPSAGEARQRHERRSAALAPQTTPGDRLGALDALGVRFLVLCGNPPWEEALLRAFPDRVVTVQRSGALSLYEIRAAGVLHKRAGNT